MVGVAAFFVVLFAYPPERALSQGKDTITKPEPFKPVLPLPIDSSVQVLDRISDKTEELNQAVKAIKENTQGIIHETQKTDKLADKLEKIVATPAPVYISEQPDTIVKEVHVSIIDSAMEGKTWFGQLFVHMKRCRGDKIFKPKQWGKGKF